MISDSEELEKLELENARLRGRIAFLKNQIEIIGNNNIESTTSIWCEAILKTISEDPI